MKITIKQLAEEREKLLTEQNELFCRVQNDKEYKELYAKLEGIKARIKSETAPRRKEIDDRISKIGKEIISLRKVKYSIKLLPDGKKWFNRYCGGKDGGQNYTVEWQSVTGRFLIVREPGGMYFAGRGNQAYAQTKYGLHDITKNEWLGGDILEHAGRFTKDVEQQFKDHALELEKPCKN